MVFQFPREFESSLPTKLADFEDLTDDECAIGVMGSNGDTKHMWNPKKKDEVEEARRLFTLLTNNGYRAYKMSKNARSGEPLEEFDPDLKRILFVPPFQGG